MTELLLNLNPGLIVILAGMICAVLPASQIRKLLVIAAPIAGIISISMLYTEQAVIGGIIEIGGQSFTTLRIDSLSLIWGYMFCVVGVLNGIFGLHEKCQITDSSALIYMGSAIGGVFAGDLLTLFLFWEIAAVSSVPLIWKGGERAYAAGVRYLAIHIFSGVALLAGAIIYGHANGGDFTFGARCLSKGVDYGYGDPLGLYDEARGLCLGARLCWRRHPDLYWRSDDGISCVLCCHRE